MPTFESSPPEAEPSPGSANPKHYAFILSWPFDSLGGVNGVVRNLLREFQTERQILPMAIEATDSAAGAVPVSEARPWPLIRTGQISTWNPKRPFRSVLAFLVKAPLLLGRLRTMCRLYSIAVLNPHFIGIEYLPLVILRRLRIFRGKVILSFHGSDIRAMIQSRGLERRLSRALVLGADLLVSCSDGLREEILLFAPERADKTIVIHNGIDSDAFLALASELVELPEKFAGKKIILSVGAYEYKKGHDILLRAFARVKDAHPDIVLVVAGQRSAAEVARLAAELGIQDEVLLLENVPYIQILSLMKRADLFVFSSRWEKGVCGEGFAMALLEAAAATIPVVTTQTCGAAELIQDGETGRIVPTDDPQSLAEAISSQLNNPQAALQMAQRLHRHVVKNFTWQQAYVKYVSAIDSLNQVE